MDNENQTERIPFLGIIKSGIVWIIVITILASVAGFCYGKFIAKPRYTAKCNVIFKVRFVDESSSGNALNDYALAQRTLPTLVSTVESPDVIEEAKSYHNDSEITGSAFKVAYDPESLIFTISYTDYSPELAKGRLEDIFAAAKKVVVERKVFTFTDLELVKTQNKISVSGVSETKKYTLICAAIGVLSSIIVLVMIFLFDNKVKSSGELENLTQTDVITVIPR